MLPVNNNCVNDVWETDFPDDLEILQWHAPISPEDVLLSYKGPLNDSILSGIIKELRGKISSCNPGLSKKIFSIFIEMATNVSYYSKERNCFAGRDRVGNIAVIRSGGGYILMSSNLIFTESSKNLSQKIQKINSLDRETLRGYKRELRAAENTGESRGAGIGLVQMALTSDKPIQAYLRKLDSLYSFFTIAIELETNPL